MKSLGALWWVQKKLIMAGIDNPFLGKFIQSHFDGSHYTCVARALNPQLQEAHQIKALH